MISLPPAVATRKIDPDFSQILKVLKRQKPDRSTLFEFFLNDPLYEALSGMPIQKDEDVMVGVRRLVKAFARAGYDYATCWSSSFGFPAGPRHWDKSCSLNEGFVITDRATFAQYAWQDPEACDYSRLEKVRPDLPAGMKLIVCGPGGVLENVISLAGYDNLCFMIADEPDLVRDIFEAVGSRLVKHYRIAGAFDTVGACISNDDWGFKTQTMLAPADMRKFVFPWHRKIVETIHAAGKPAILHSCGYAGEILEDVIAMGYDARHSYEDTIQPVEQAYEEYAGRLAVLGGMDLDFVCRAKPAEITRRSRAMLDRAASRGGYALGTGNSVPTYVPPENYFAMIEAAIAGR
jgi:uroporphyrinogen decarboxylase